MSRFLHLKPAAYSKAGVVLGGAAVLFGLTAFRPGRGHPVEIIPPGSVVEVRVVSALASDSVAVGDISDGRIESLQVGDAKAALPLGAPVKLLCVAVRKAEGDARPGYLRLTLTSIANSAGKFRSAETSTYSQWGEGCTYGSVNTRPATGGETLPAAGMPGTARAAAGLSNEAVISPDVPLSFVLLKPMAMDGLAPSH